MAAGALRHGQRFVVVLSASRPHLETFVVRQSITVSDNLGVNVAIECVAWRRVALP